MFITKILYLSCIGFIVISLPLVAMDGRIVITGGVGVGYGTAVGRACVITGFNQLDKICKGDIVVTSTTNSSWNDALALSAGIITEKGDGSSHAALMGKKFGIPVIVGVKEATKKIVHGTSISFDCANTIVYEVVENLATLVRVDKPQVPIIFYNHKRFNSGLSSYDWLTSSSTEQVEQKEIIVTTNNRHDYHDHHHHTVHITKEKLCHDKLSIKKNVMGKVANDICKAWWSGRWAATLLITGYAYDSIPFEFFEKRNSKALEDAFNRLEDGADYIKEKKEIFKKQIMGNAKKIDDSKIAEFLYKNVVDHINVTDEHRKILQEDPTQMDEFVRKKIVSRTEYTYYTLLNFTMRYYLEQELDKK